MWFQPGQEVADNLGICVLSLKSSLGKNQNHTSSWLRL